ncbi:flavodoxin [Amorphoplanes digitatis]|nr:flavodoxin [Actinoplanes digitatis]
MNVLVVTETCFGNTARVADAIVAGLRSHGAVVTVADAASAPAVDHVDLLLVGAPTHSMGLPGPGTRRQAEAKGGNPPAIGVAEWLNALPGKQTCRGAAFDTVTGRGFFSGSAAKGIEKRLRRHGVDVVARESFLVNAMEGPPADGELARAERWGASLG